MADNRQYMALEWVIRDIKETLSQAQQALDAYVKESADVIQLKFCLTYIHQVYGSLHVSGFYGAAMIASEIEELAQGLLDNEVVHRTEATDVLMRAIIKLPEYLEYALKEKRDQPSLVFSLLNDLRAVRGASFLSESTLFSPNLDYANTIVGSRNRILQDKKQYQLVLTKLREMYQYAAGSIIHGNNVTENLSYLLKVSQRLEKILSGTKRFALWEIVSAFVSSLQNDLLSETASIKELLRQLDGEFEVLINGGTVALESTTNDELLKNLLYCLSSLNDDTAEIKYINQTYGLSEAFSVVHSVDYSQVAKPVDSDAMRAVTSAILEEFSEVKERFDDCRKEKVFATNFQDIYSAFQRVADTLAILGIGHLRETMLQNIESLEELNEVYAVRTLSQKVFPEEQIVLIEESIKTIEDELTASLNVDPLINDVASFYFDETEKLALQDSRNGLEEAKDAVVNYIASQWDIKSLQLVPEVLRNVSSLLSSLALPLASSILSTCANHLERNVIHSKTQLKWEQLDSLADVIASVDYFLEALSLTKVEDNDILLGAEKGLIELGVPASRVKEIVDEYTSPKNSSVDASNNSVSDESNTSEPNQGDQVNHDESQSIVDNAESLETMDDDDRLDAEAEAEIIEIFAEEAEEVQQTIEEYLPQWQESFKNKEALIEIRRAFHTLKGSGRMVKATDIGELSWSVESLLNRVRDETLAPSQLHVGLIKKILLLLPEMVNAFALQQKTPDIKTCRTYQIWAEQLAKGEEPEDLLLALDENSHHSLPAPEKFTVIEDEDDDIDVQLWEIFGAESETHLSSVREYIQKMESVSPFYEPPSELMQRAMHTLKGSAHMAEITPIAELMTPMELFAKDLRAYQVSINDDILQLIKDSVLYTEEALEQMSRLMYPEIKKLNLFLSRVAELRELSVGHLINHEDENSGPNVDPAFLEMLMNQGMDLLLDIDPLIAQWRESDDHSEEKTAQWQSVAKELAVVKHGAERANLQTMADLSHAISVQYDALQAKQLNVGHAFYEVLLDSHYALLDIIDAIAGGQDLPPENTELLAQLSSFYLESASNSDSEDKVSTETLLDEILGAENLETKNLEAKNVEVKSVEAESLVESEDTQNTNDIHIEDIANIESFELSDNVEEIDMVDVIDTNVIASAEPLALAPSINEIPNNIAVDELLIDESKIEGFVVEIADFIEDIDEAINAWENNEDPKTCNVQLQNVIEPFTHSARHVGAQPLVELLKHFAHYLQSLSVSPAEEQVSVKIINHLRQYQHQIMHYVSALDATAESSDIILPVHDFTNDEAPAITSSADVGLVESESTEDINTEAVKEDEGPANTIAYGIAEDVSVENDLDHSLELDLDNGEVLIAEDIETKEKNDTTIALDSIPEIISEGEAALEHVEPSTITISEEFETDILETDKVVSSVPALDEVSLNKDERPGESFLSETLSAETLASKTLPPASELAEKTPQPNLADEPEKTEVTASEIVVENSAFTYDPIDELDEIDDEIVEIFMEEAAELLDELDETIHGWESGVSAKESNAALQRLLHTFKGGARLSGLSTVGDLAHDFESYLIASSMGELPEDVIHRVHQYQDQLTHAINNYQHGNDFNVVAVDDIPVVDVESELVEHESNAVDIEETAPQTITTEVIVEEVETVDVDHTVSESKVEQDPEATLELLDELKTTEEPESEFLDVEDLVEENIESIEPHIVENDINQTLLDDAAETTVSDSTVSKSTESESDSISRNDAVGTSVPQKNNRANVFSFPGAAAPVVGSDAVISSMESANESDSDGIVEDSVQEKDKEEPTADSSSLETSDNGLQQDDVKEEADDFLIVEPQTAPQDIQTEKENLAIEEATNDSADHALSETTSEIADEINHDIVISDIDIDTEITDPVQQPASSSEVISTEKEQNNTVQIETVREKLESENVQAENLQEESLAQTVPVDAINNDVATKDEQTEDSVQEHALEETPVDLLEELQVHESEQEKRPNDTQDEQQVSSDDTASVVEGITVEDVIAEELMVREPVEDSTVTELLATEVLAVELVLNEEPVIEPVTTALEITEPEVASESIKPEEIEPKATELKFPESHPVSSTDVTKNIPSPAVITPPVQNTSQLNTGAKQSLVERRPAPQETVKVSAGLMEDLVNLAGETSISRGRIEEQVSEFGSSLHEMEFTVSRLQEQVRRLDIETEAQVVFRQEQLADDEEFDSLEMDRYSALQQLSRSLIESVSDLRDLKTTLSDKTRDTETVLLQQSRINTELQEGLMRSRMVPFSRIVPRLRRTVRQTAAELQRQVEINFEHTEGELDRNMMERIVAPLEHMLRNAVDHGIETAAIRQQQNKPAMGTISLAVKREGGNVLLLLSDDGAGMSVERIKQKAIERQLMNPSADISDQEILQFIFQPGFSMAETVTQISGRGVGMDVVSSEIKQLGGNIEIYSEEGKGTQFTIRLPFTVSVNRALMVDANNNKYAIPIDSIDGIARINPNDLAEYYNNPNKYFEYADQQYKLIYMGNLLNSDVAPDIDSFAGLISVPVLLINSGDHAYAIQVDGLQGSREIVVKTLGSQFGRVSGLSGATIMGDGHVVIILDVHAIIRQRYVLSAAALAAPIDTPIAIEAPARNPLILVVDDSVTVRKVTARFLERANFDVIMAKDGVNALEVLQENKPDLMLLDIEMPRMDGFEVAKNVRLDDSLKYLPIIMITSRTGEKHRQTGLAAGANEYMGKPFQETELLASIKQLLNSNQKQQ